jgi:multicomponent Na+:H+ antiporter subunit G
MRDGVTLTLLIVGLGFMLTGTWGIVRFPDAYHRLHAASKCSTLGLFGLLAAAVVHIGSPEAAAKALLTLVFAVVATPVGSHILAKSAHATGLVKWSRTLSDELAEDLAEDQPDDEGNAPS